MTKLYTTVAFLLAGSAIFSTAVFAQTGLANSAWPAFRHDVFLTARGQTTGPAAPQLRWTASLGRGQLGAPAIGSDGTIYVPGNVNDTLYAVTPDGRLQWSFTGKKLPGEAFAAPVVSGQDGVVYFGSTQNIFYAVNPNGTLKWSVALDGAVRFSANIGSDGTIYVAAHDCRLYAMAPDGTIKWRFFLARFPGNAPAIASDGTIYVVAGEFLQGFMPDGSRRLEVNCSDIGVLNGLVVDGFELIYVSGLTSPHVRAISKTGATRWQYDFPASFGAPQLPAMGKDGSLYFASTESSQIMVLNRDGSQRWAYSHSGAKFFTELVVDAADQIYIMNDFSGLLSASASGQVRWMMPKVESRFSPAFGADGTIYLAGDKKLYAVGSAASPQPEIEITPLALEFGKICREAQLYTIVSNAGDIILRVDSLVFSNAAFSTAHAKSFTVAPGSRDTIHVRFKFAAATESNGALSIFSNDADEKMVAVKLHGAGGVPDIAGLAEVDFGAVDVQTCAGLSNAATRTYLIRNAGSCDLRIDSLAAAGFFSLTSPSLPQIVSAGGSLNVSLKFTPASAGDHAGALRVISNDSDARAMIVALRGRGLAVPDIAVTPGDTLDFGAVTIGNQKNATINIRNLGELKLNVMNLDISSSRFTTTTRQLNLVCKQDSAVTMAFVPDSTGIFTATLSLASNDPDEASVRIFLRGQGTKSAQAFIAADSLRYRFPATCAGGVDSLRAVVTNKGNAALRVDSVRIQQSQRIFYAAAAGFILEAQSSKTLTVFFKPAQRATYDATLQFFSNALNARNYEIQLQGQGGGPEVYGAGHLIFASTEVGSIRRDFYQINNAGECALIVTSVKIEGEHANEFKVSDAGANVIEPRGSSRLTLEFKPAVSSPRRALLVIASADPSRPRFEVTLNGNGRGLPGKLAGPHSIDFGQACFDESAGRECVLANSGQSDLTITRLLTARGELFKIAGAVQLPRILRPQESVAIPLAFTPKNTGVFSDTLLVQTDLSGASLRVELRGVGRNDMAVLNISRRALAFDGHLDEVKTELITITNAGCGRLEISQVELAHKLRVFEIRPEIPLPVLLEKNASLNVSVLFKGDDFRVFADSLYIYCRDWQQNVERLSVSLLGKVMDGAPCLQAASRLDFGEVAVGQTKRLDLEVTNCSADSRIIVRAVQPTSGHFNILPDTLRIFPQNPQFFAVNFAPRRNGEMIDTLRLVYYTQTEPGQQQVEKIVLRGAATGNRTYALPNAFTPNGDGKNDVAKIHFIGYDPATLVLRVYDLRGLEVRLLRPERRGEFAVGWDGRNDRGTLQLPGAYLWLLEDNGKKVGSGQIVLIR